MATETQETGTIWPELKAMDAGDMTVFPIERTLTVRTLCSQLGVAENKVFRTKTNRETRTISVYRES